MTLRARLALLYTFIVGGILVLFSSAVYISASLTLLNQVNQTLVDTAEDVINISWVTEDGKLDVQPLPVLDLSRDVYIQIWRPDGSLVKASPNISNLDEPLDAFNQFTTSPTIRDRNLFNAHLRVLTVPLAARGSDRISGILQVATSLETVDATQRTLLIVLAAGSLITVLISGFASWMSTGQALAPLETVTQTALQITRADDLSRRIPYRGPATDEVGQLITAFNQTLERLEKLFNSQRRFLVDVGHELRTPLTVIKGNIQLLRRMGATEEDMDSIDNEVDRLTRLVGDLLLLAQAESGRLPMANNLLELDTLTLEVLQ
ncbi:MAG TPA: histidine kinase dimerization/phospho-acceptor domain-containing protein, partial [Anaerolineales bacterium]|nr:histidine kinase dimerization/phospho-acceptor domain-containing protein [Anaerolineales bacterium]